MTAPLVWQVMLFALVLVCTAAHDFSQHACKLTVVCWLVQHAGHLCRLHLNDQASCFSAEASRKALASLVVDDIPLTFHSLTFHSLTFHLLTLHSLTFHSLTFYSLTFHWHMIGVLA